LHGEHIFECYTKVALNLLPANTSEAIKVCDRVAEKYRDRVPLIVEDECYSAIAREVVKEKPDLAIDLCAKATTKPPFPDSINYRERCVKDIAAIIAQKDLSKSAPGDR
jgi:hypothetical protein